MTDLEKAQAIVADLETRRAAVMARQDKAAKDRKAVAYDALATGDKVAGTKLQLINNAAMTAATELASLDAALAEARRRVAAAEAAEALAAERERMRGVTALTQHIRERAARLDELLRDTVAEYDGFLNAVHELHSAGFTQPNLALVAVNAPRAVQSTFVGSHLESERVPPAQRHSFAELAQGWTAGIDARAAAVLAGEEQAA